MVFRSATLLVALLVVAACSGPATVVEPIPPPVEPAGYPAYETFDPSAYDDEPAPQPAQIEIEHDVPASLMAGTIIDQGDGRPEDAPAIVEGYRIQLFSSESKTSADAVRDDVANWWRSAQRDDTIDRAFPFGLRPAVVFSRPYYRVRIGAFPSREGAQDALGIVRERFPEAFIVPDTITLSNGD